MIFIQLNLFSPCVILFAVYKFTYPSFENVCDFIFYVQTLDSAIFMCVYWLEDLVLIFLLVVAQSTSLHATVSRADSAQIYCNHISTVFGFWVSCRTWAV